MPQHECGGQRALHWGQFPLFTMGPRDLSQVSLPAESSSLTLHWLLGFWTTLIHSLLHSWGVYNRQLKIIIQLRFSDTHSCDCKIFIIKSLKSHNYISRAKHKTSFKYYSCLYVFIVFWDILIIPWNTVSLVLKSDKFLISSPHFCLVIFLYFVFWELLQRNMHLLEEAGEYYINAVFPFISLISYNCDFIIQTPCAHNLFLYIKTSLYIVHSQFSLQH